MNRKRETMNIAKRVKRQYAKRRKTAIEMFLRREWKNPADEYLRQPNDAREEKPNKPAKSLHQKLMGGVHAALLRIA